MKLRDGMWISFLIILLTSGCAVSLNEAIQKGDLDDIKSIVSEDRAKINERDDSGNTILHNAVREGNIEIVKYLLSQDADVNIKNSGGETALQIAIYSNNEELIKYLVSNGADVNFKGVYDESPLHDAIMKGNIEIVKYLVSRGANFNTKNNVQESPLYAAVKNNRLDIVKYLISQGAEVNTKDYVGGTLLHEAASQGNLELSRYLISQGANTNARNKYDISPLHDAADEGHPEIVKLLISQGTDVDARGAFNLHYNPLQLTLGCTPLHLAANKGHLEIVKYLISHGAEFNAKNNEGDTPLIIARAEEHNEVVTFLVSLEKQTKLSKTKVKIEPVPTKKKPVDDSIKIKTFSHPDINFGRYFALVIGNNNYQFLPKLMTAKSDAAEVAETLNANYGFRVQLIVDANRATVLLALINLRNNLTERDNLLIYYAGHGWLDKEADEGYWLPIDAERDNMVNWISNSSITSTLRALRAKHVLVAADSCYSGKLARGIHTVRRSPGYLSRLSKKRARCVISSGGLEPVIDSGGKGLHSVFASAFLDTLSENKGIMDGTLFFNKLRRQVMLNSDQTPEYSDIRKAGHEGGEFLFVRKR
jgi:ankyrin repeat protein